MNIPSLSIKRPIFISCIFILILALGYLSMNKLGVDLFPNITFPVIMVNTPYPGASPAEIESLISKPLEDEISTLSGVKKVSSLNRESLSTVIAEFTLETDIKYAEQKIRERVASVRPKLPSDSKESVVRTIDPAEKPVLIISLSAQLDQKEMYDLADQIVRPRLEQADKVGLVEVLGGRKREIRVELDRYKLKEREFAASWVAGGISSAGRNVPAGKIDSGNKETVIRTLAEFTSLKDIEQTIVNFWGNEVPVTVNKLGNVIDTLEEEKSRTYIDGHQAILLNVYRQSGSNTIAVVNNVRKRLDALQSEIKDMKGLPKLSVVRDTSKFIRANVDDVKEAIIIGIVLTVIVVYLFLGSLRSTIITGLSLPNSLLGAFILMAACGFTINIMTLLAMSLAVGLLIDDAIVVRENIFRHLELGQKPRDAALNGTLEVILAVVATTLTVIAVFGPVAFLNGIVGQFFKEFGLTICFAMIISFLDAITMAPMLSAYMAGTHSEDKKENIFYAYTIGAVLKAFNTFQDWLEAVYESILKFTVRFPLVILFLGAIVFLGSMYSVTFVRKTFMPPADNGEFSVELELEPSASLDATAEVAYQIDTIVRNQKEVKQTLLTVGGRNGEANMAQIYVDLLPSKKRKPTSDVKEDSRQLLKSFTSANPKIKDVDLFIEGQQPFNVNLVGNDSALTEKFAMLALEQIKKIPDLQDVDTSFRMGKPEFQIIIDKQKSQNLGVSSLSAGMELRALVEGIIPAVYREAGREYDIRVRLQKDQRDIRQHIENTYVPNLNRSMIPLNKVAKIVETKGPAIITRQNRARYIQISAAFDPKGGGMAKAMDDVTRIMKDLHLPEGVKFQFVGQAESFQELAENILIAGLLAILFIYLVLASLYESFIIPFTIMLVLPLAACGAFLALAITDSTLDIFSMIGCIMLLGIATKNSILLVDYTLQLSNEGMERNEAIIKACKTRLRPILMTTIALIAGMIPIAIGLNEASKQRTSMGIAVIGGLLSSTFLSLLIVPATYSYIDRFRLWFERGFKKIVGNEGL